MSRPISAFLDLAGWGGANISPLAGDASSRRYARVHVAGNSAILMIAPPEDRAAFDAFLAVALRLRDVGLSAPDILSARPRDGLMLLEDLGDRSFADAQLPLAAMDTAVDVLIHLAHGNLDWGAARMTPAAMAEMTKVALPTCEGAAAALQQMETLFTRYFTRPPVPCLRDFHAENLLWLPGRTGLGRVGLLDFQDAVMAPPGYDLTSLTHDARRGMAADRQAALTARYAEGLGLATEPFAAECAVLIFQRNLRILGIFRRLAETRGKPAYLAHLPRVFGYVEGALRHPALRDLARTMAPLMPGLAP